MLVQAFLDLSLLDAPNVKAPFLQAKKQGQAALLAYSRSTLHEQTVKGFQTKGKVSASLSQPRRRFGLAAAPHNLCLAGRAGGPR